MTPINLFFAIIFFFLVNTSQGYSVLTHLAIIDASWDSIIVPVLLKKFPDNNSPDELRKAKAFAYGGALIPDMGYFPRGKKLFTNLVHYVRTGDLGDRLFEEARDMNELSFAVGYLAHYVSDVYGHSIAINPVVPLLYPDTKKKFSDTVTFEDSPINHQRTEFCFDVIEVARGKYSSSDYHDFIGIEVPKEQLARAFQKTYGLELSAIMPDFDIKFITFRWIVIKFIPRVSRVAWRVKRKEVERSIRNIERKKIVFSFHQKEFQKQFGKGYQVPGVGTKIVATLINTLPKPGTMKLFSFKSPSVEAHSLFAKSFQTSIEVFSNILKNIPTNETSLINLNMDTGKTISHHTYCITDKTYFKLLKIHKQKEYKNMTTELKENILLFYSSTKNSDEVELFLNDLINIKD